MAHWMTPNEEQLVEWQQWLDDPENATVRSVAEKLVPWGMYLYKPTNHRCRIYSYDFLPSMNEVRLTITITGEDNFISFGRAVFDVPPSDLEPCDLPGKDEVLGEYFTEDQKVARVNEMRAEHGLPPLTKDEMKEFTLGGNGKSICPHE